MVPRCRGGINVHKQTGVLEKTSPFSPPTLSASGSFLENMYVNPALLTCGLDNACCGRPVLCIVGCIIPSLASIHQIPVAHTPASEL